MPTTTYAEAGVFQSAQGNDFIHFTNGNGNVLFAVNQNGVEIVSNGAALVGTGNPLVVAIVNASLGFAVFNANATVNLLPTTAPTGTYRISMYGVTTSGFTTNTEETITFGWTDDDQAQTLVLTTTAKTAGTTLIGSQLIRSVTGNVISYAPNVTGSPATTGAMAVSIVVEQLI